MFFAPSWQIWTAAQFYIVSVVLCASKSTSLRINIRIMTQEQFYWKRIYFFIVSVACASFMVCVFACAFVCLFSVSLHCLCVHTTTVYCSRFGVLHSHMFEWQNNKTHTHTHETRVRMLLHFIYTQDIFTFLTVWRRRSSEM